MSLLLEKNQLSIITPRLVLQPPIASDFYINEYVTAIDESIYQLKSWLPWAKHVPSHPQAEWYIATCNRNWIEKNNNNLGLVIWIIDQTTNELIGSMTIWNIVWEIPKFEFGFWLRTSQTGKGYITEAINALTRYSFMEMGANRIEIRCESGNIKAQHVPQRLNFTLDGVLKKSTRVISSNELTDTFLFSRIDLENLPDLKVSW